MNTPIETSVLSEAPVLDIDPYAEDVLANPYPFHDQLRRAGPIVRIRPHNVYAVGRYGEVKTVLSDHTRFMAGAGIGIQDIRKPGQFRIPSRLLESDPPDHTRIRSVLTKILTPVVVRQWRPQVEEEAHTILQEVLAKGEFNGVDDLVEAYVLRAFQRVVGVSLPREETLAIGAMRFNQSGPPNALHQRALAAAQPYLAWFEKSVQRESVRPDSVADLIFKAEDAGDLDEGVASNTVRSFVGGGTDSTISGLGTAVMLLAQNPDQWALARQDPGRLKFALDEAIRLEAPFQVTYRTTVAETELNGVRLDADTKVACYLGAAGRDPEQWSDPDRFDLTRQVAGVHASFGTAHHACIGQMLARLEAECLLSALVKSVQSIELTGRPTWRLMNQLRTLDALPMRVVAA